VSLSCLRCWSRSCSRSHHPNDSRGFRRSNHCPSFRRNESRYSTHVRSFRRLNRWRSCCHRGYPRSPIQGCCRWTTRCRSTGHRRRTRTQPPQVPHSRSHRLRSLALGSRTHRGRFAHRNSGRTRRTRERTKQKPGNAQTSACHHPSFSLAPRRRLSCQGALRARRLVVGPLPNDRQATGPSIAADVR
jgi:hypothetical protein